MSVRRMIAATALSAGVFVSAGAGIASAQSPQQVLPQQIVRVEGTQLSRTGQDSMPMVVVGAGLAASGAALVVLARRQRATVEVS